MNYTIAQAARMYERLIAEYYAANEAGWAADRMFDAGEWSGPWIHEKQQSKEAELLTLVAKRTGHSEEEIDLKVRRREWYQLDCTIERLNPRSRLARVINSI